MSDQIVARYGTRVLAVSAAVMLALSAGPVTADGARVVASATGGYQATYGGNSATRTIAFTAQKDARGNAKGEGQLVNFTTGAVLHFTVDCLHVSGNVATISGHWDRDLLPDFPFMWLQVQDNGEGSGKKDAVSPLYSGDDNTSLNCNDYNFDNGGDELQFEVVPGLDGGNIQVMSGR